MNAGLVSIEDRIREEFLETWKEYAASDRTLDALAALLYALKNVREINQETELLDFTPRLEVVDLDAGSYTPDGLILQKPADFVLELKTSWNHKDVRQTIKYGKSSAYFLSGGSKKQKFKYEKCVLLGYQNPPGKENLDKLFEEWKANSFPFPLVVFRYSLEQGPEGDRMFFSRVPYDRNGLCPNTKLGQAFNSTRGYSVKADNYRLYRPKFHKTNDQVTASYAAVLWWTKYANHYLSDEQKTEMAVHGRLSSPFVIPLNKIDQVPTLPDVEVPLGPNDVRRALQFLQEAGMVKFKKQSREFEILLKEDRYIRLPQSVPTSRSDIAAKILGKWAANKIRKPSKTPKQPKRRTRGHRGRSRDQRSLFSQE
jgi:hypothetical protein